MYNLAEQVVNALIVHQDGNRKFAYNVAFSDASFIIRDYLKSYGQPDAVTVEARILQHVIPIRPSRADEPKICSLLSISCRLKTGYRPVLSACRKFHPETENAPDHLI